MTSAPRPARDHRPGPGPPRQCPGVLLDLLGDGSLTITESAMVA